MATNKKKLNNEGSAIVTVIIVSAFVAVIITTLIYVTAMNYRVKQLDYQNKVSFYAGETALEQVKAHITEDFSQACQLAYGQTMSQYTLNDEGNRTQIFRRKVYENLKDIWDAKTTENTQAGWNTMLRSYVDTKYQSALSIDFPDPAPIGFSPIAYDEVAGVVRLQGIELDYNNNGYVTKISTDIYIAIPGLDWSIQGSRSSFDGGTPEENAGKLERNYFDASECVVFSNWSKN